MIASWDVGLSVARVFVSSISHAAYIVPISTILVPILTTPRAHQVHEEVESMLLMSPTALGATRTKYGWMFWPDVCGYGPLYFSLMQVGEPQDDDGSDCSGDEEEEEGEDVEDEAGDDDGRKAGDEEEEDP